MRRRPKIGSNGKKSRWGWRRSRKVGVRLTVGGGGRARGSRTTGLAALLQGRAGIPLGLVAGLLLAFALTAPGWFAGDKAAPAEPPEWLAFEPYQPKHELAVAPDSPLVPVYLSADGQVANVPLEVYVRGVVAAEMPAEFHLEALKAQAIASRTYIVKRLLEGRQDNVPPEAASLGAIVTDGVAHQAYKTEEALKRQWGPREYAFKMDRLNQAVNDTAGIIATYDGQPIDAAFFSTSNGYTENSEDYWTTYVPYLRSVPSPWDAEISPKYKQTTVVEADAALEKLGVPQAAMASGTGIQPIDYTAGKRIRTIRIGDREFTGRELREKLDLPSSHILLRWAGERGDLLEITTFGYGHGVGMSQYGAEGMAQDGQAAEAILKHYYQGIELRRVTPDTFRGAPVHKPAVVSHTIKMPAAKKSINRNV